VSDIIEAQVQRHRVNCHAKFRGSVSTFLVIIGQPSSSFLVLAISSSMRALDVVQGIGQRCELLHGIFLPLVRRGPVPHRPNGFRRRFRGRLVCVKDGD